MKINKILFKNNENYNWENIKQDDFKSFFKGFIFFNNILYKKNNIIDFLSRELNDKISLVEF